MYPILSLLIYHNGKYPKYFTCIIYCYFNHYFNCARVILYFILVFNE